jgi:hypothetical protein
MPKVLRYVLGFLNERLLGRLAQVSKTWLVAASDEFLWKELFTKHYPDDKQRKRVTLYKDLFRSHVERAKDPLNIKAPMLDSSAVGARATSNSRRRNTATVTISASTGKRGTSRRQRDGTFPLILTDAYAMWSKELLAWLSDQIVEDYALSPSACDSLSSLRSGVALLALAHKVDPSALDYEGFDKKSPEKCLTISLTSLEDALGVPALLDVRDLATNGDPRATLLWLAAVRSACDETERDPNAHAVHTELTQIQVLFDESFARVGTLEDEFAEASLELGAVLATQDSAEEKVFLEARALLMEKALTEALATITSLDERNTLLQEENRVLQEKLAIVERDLRVEENTRRRVEEQLEIEERIRAAGEELSDRGALDYLKLFEKHEDAAAAVAAPQTPSSSSSGVSSPGGTSQPLTPSSAPAAAGAAMEGTKQ